MHSYSEGVQQGQWLLVLDGRFLPVHETVINIERDVDDVFSSGSKFQPVTSEATVRIYDVISGNIRTTREPEVKSNPKQLLLYGPDELFVIWNPHVVKLDVRESAGRNSVKSYNIEFESVEWARTKKNWGAEMIYE